MDLTRLSILAFAFSAGCGSTLQVGLANAPGLGGTTPESRVSDVIANGQDACERSGSRQGEVLRGQIPACGPRTSFVANSTDLGSTPATDSSSTQYLSGTCPSFGRSSAATATSLTSISLWPSSRLCRATW
ncbi:MAG: hypothetical protein ABTD50_10405 [Polyangiaceae bacterium]